MENNYISLTQAQQLARDDFGCISKNAIYNLSCEKEVGAMTWNEKVLNLMNERNINQKQLSQLSGINESSISRYLHSGQKPRMDVVVNIAKALQVETEYLLDEGETTESAYNTISTAIARKGGELTAEEKNQLIALLIGKDGNV